MVELLDGKKLIDVTITGEATVSGIRVIIFSVTQ